MYTLLSSCDSIPLAVFSFAELLPILILALFIGESSMEFFDLTCRGGAENDCVFVTKLKPKQLFRDTINANTTDKTMSMTCKESSGDSLAQW